MASTTARPSGSSFCPPSDPSASTCALCAGSGGARVSAPSSSAVMPAVESVSSSAAAAAASPPTARCSKTCAALNIIVGAKRAKGSPAVAKGPR